MRSFVILALILILSFLICIEFIVGIKNFVIGVSLTILAIIFSVITDGIGLVIILVFLLIWTIHWRNK